MERVIVIGAPGSGKSTVGSLLAQKLDVPFIDTDQLIELESGTSISEIFMEHGESHFRHLEKECIDRVLKRVSDEPAVVSLGGGSILNPQTQQTLKAFSSEPGTTILWLQVDIGEAIKRVGMNQARPLLLGNVRANMIKLLNERTPIYEDLATLSVETSGQSPDVVSQLVAELVAAGEQRHD